MGRGAHGPSFPDTGSAGIGACPDGAAKFSARPLPERGVLAGVNAISMKRAAIVGLLCGNLPCIKLASSLSRLAWLSVAAAGATIHEDARVGADGIGRVPV
jgi:hypothetical protein